MKNGKHAPVDVIELLLRDIARRLRHAPLAVLVLIAGCSSPTPAAPAVSGPAPIPAPAPYVPVLVVPHCSSDAQCGGDLPRCNADGACIACVAASDCASANQACNSGRCGACTTHDQCTSGRCEANGRCAPLSAVVYVDHDQSCRNEAHASAPTDPYCEIAPALPATGEVVVQLAPSATPYAAVLIDAQQPMDVALMGSGADEVSILAGATAAAVQVDAMHDELASVLVHGVTLLGSAAGFGLSCSTKSSHGKLTLDSVVVKNGGSFGISTTYCDLTLSNSSVHDNALVGVALLGATATLSNDYLFDNSGGGLWLTDMTGTFEHLTVIGNRADLTAGVACDGPNLIADSIVVGNLSASVNDVDAQTAPPCLLSNTAAEGRGLACQPVFLKMSDPPTLDTSTPALAAGNACATGLGADGNP